MPPSPSPSPAVVCAWCGRELQPGGSPVSHGICPDCQARVGGKSGAARDAEQPVSANFTQK